MKTALIGYTGFVGSNINEQMNFSDLYNSKNISDIKGKKYDLIICAGVKAVKWWANKNPEEDLKGINKLIDNIKKVKCSRFILISTVDVYNNPIEVDEDFNFDEIINNHKYHAYGKNRIYLENFIKNNFNNYNIIRLPGLFGKNLKKNIIFDLLNNNQTENIIPNYILQYYNLDNIIKDINKVVDNNIKVINFNSEPIESNEIISLFNNPNIGNKSDNVLIYNYYTKYFKIFNGVSKYMYTKKQIISDLKKFISNYKK